MLATIVQYLIPFLLVLSVVVFVHEFGHYWVARRNGVRIEVFSIGFGPELFGRNDRHGTRWKFSAIPLGGYVKMLGDADAASATVDAAHARDPDSFPSKNVWQRMAIVVAGPVANFLFAIVVAGDPVRRGRAPVHAGRRSARSSPTARPPPRGLLPGDRITAVGGSRSRASRSCRRSCSRQCGPAAAAVDRPRGRGAGAHRHPGHAGRHGPLRQPAPGLALIGVSRPGVEYRRSNPFLAVFEAVGETGKMIGGTLYALGEMVVGQRGTQELGGPLRIAQMSGQIAQDGFVPALWFTAVLSINLGLINLFPIPDAGRRPPRDVRHRGRARSATQRAQSGDRLPLRARHGAEPDGVRHLERRRALRGGWSACSNLIS